MKNTLITISVSCVVAISGCSMFNKASANKPVANSGGSTTTSSRPLAPFDKDKTYGVDEFEKMYAADVLANPKESGKKYSDSMITVKGIILDSAQMTNGRDVYLVHLKTANEKNAFGLEFEDKGQIEKVKKLKPGAEITAGGFPTMVDPGDDGNGINAHLIHAIVN